MDSGRKSVYFGVILMNAPSFYAVIPANVRYDKTIPANAKLLYGEITALCNKEGYCWATNGYFAELYDVSETSISKWISSLVKAGYICLEIDKEKGNTRLIYLKEVYNKTSRPIEEKLKTPIEEKLKHNNTETNPTSNKGQNKFTQPTPEEIANFIKERNLDVSVESFYLHYESNGWMVGKVKMKSWKHTVLKWHNQNQKPRVK